MKLYYCDKCAKEYNYPIKEKETKGSCNFCRFTGPVNEEQKVNLVDMKDFNETTWKGGGFTVNELVPFPVGQTRGTIHPELLHKFLNERYLLFYDKNLLIIANIKTGQQIQVSF